LKGHGFSRAVKCGHDDGFSHCGTSILETKSESPQRLKPHYRAQLTARLKPCPFKAHCALVSTPKQQTFHHRKPLCHLYCRNMFRAMKSTLAGRSARRRMKYGYHSVPNGM